MNRYYIAAAAGLLLAVLALVIWLIRRRKSPDEMERERRLHVHAIGRMIEGQIVEGEIFGPQSSGRILLCFRYHAAGVEYTAAQDVTTLAHLFTQENCIPGRPATVKYDPQNPSNSIVVCESWTGLHDASITTTTSAGVHKEILKAG